MQTSLLVRLSACSVVATMVMVVGWSTRAAAGNQNTASASPAADARWWLTEPIRFLQTNLSETRLDG